MLKRVLTFSLFFVLSACVTVNITFPPAAAQQAAPWSRAGDSPHRVFKRVVIPAKAGISWDLSRPVIRRFPRSRE